jgi:uncharacterized membrane protein YeaQ/YmgE (transglycosylase-associated protein family)
MEIGEVFSVGSLIFAIVVGLVVGALARLILPGRQNISVLLTIVVGIIGALVGTVLANALEVGDTSGVDWIEVVFQVLVAAAGVWIVSAFNTRARVH